MDGTWSNFFWRASSTSRTCSVDPTSRLGSSNEFVKFDFRLVYESGEGEIVFGLDVAAVLGLTTEAEGFVEVFRTEQTGEGESAVFVAAVAIDGFAEDVDRAVHLVELFAELLVLLRKLHRARPFEVIPEVAEGERTERGRPDDGKRDRPVKGDTLHPERRDRRTAFRDEQDVEIFS